MMIVVLPFKNRSTSTPRGRDALKSAKKPRLESGAKGRKEKEKRHHDRKTSFLLSLVVLAVAAIASLFPLFVLEQRRQQQGGLVNYGELEASRARRCRDPFFLSWVRGVGGRGGWRWRSKRP